MTYTTNWVRERIMATVRRTQPRFWVLAVPSRVWSPSLNYATSPRVTERIDRERAAELAILNRWFPCAKCRKQLWEHVARGKSSGCCQLESTFHSGIWGQGFEEPQSLQETRQVLDKQSRVVTVCRSTVSEQTRSRTRERTHECVSEFVSLAHACLGTKQ